MHVVSLTHFNLAAPEVQASLLRVGFVFCNKDQRYECRKKLPTDAIVTLRKHVILESIPY